MAQNPRGHSAMEKMQKSERSFGLSRRDLNELHLSLISPLTVAGKEAWLLSVEPWPMGLKEN